MWQYTDTLSMAVHAEGVYNTVIFWGSVKCTIIIICYTPERERERWCFGFLGNSGWSKVSKLKWGSEEVETITIIHSLTKVKSNKINVILPNDGTWKDKAGRVISWREQPAAPVDLCRTTNWTELNVLYLPPIYESQGLVSCLFLLCNGYPQAARCVGLISVDLSVSDEVCGEYL